MKAVAAVRKALKVRTAFNILGPLLNPASTKYSLIGVYSPALSPLLGATLQKLGIEKALIVHSQGLDELTPMGDAHVVEVTPTDTKSYRHVFPVKLTTATKWSLICVICKVIRTYQTLHILDFQKLLVDQSDMLHRPPLSRCSVRVLFKAYWLLWPSEALSNMISITLQ